jgi:uncharacterized protein
LRIGVISDTHGMPESWKKALAIFQGADLVIHAGDVLYHPPRIPCVPGYDLSEMVRLLNESPIPLLIARGNCDCEVYEELLETPVQAPYALAQYDDLRIIVSHGHLLNRDEMIRLGKHSGASVVISGHTHIPILEMVDGLVLMNPGSAAIPKYEKNGAPLGSVGLITDGLAQILSIEDGSLLFELPIK